VKKNEIVSLAGKRMELEIRPPSKTRQTEDKCHRLSLTYRIKTLPKEKGHGSRKRGTIGTSEGEGTKMGNEVNMTQGH
jgi:hypothetical protein